jgi:hypothetical protein
VAIEHWLRMIVRHVRSGRWRTSLLSGAVLFAAAPATAVASTSVSSNWSGYVAHQKGITFNRVQASWKQPVAVCQPGEAGYSAFWVGLGGYRTNSSNLEQIGTELDCTAGGRSKASAWYELVPSPTKRLRMTIRPGDDVSASVTVTGHRVTLRITDSTRHESFAKRVTVTSVDTTSADWIVEAPSACTTTGFCETLPLTDFGSIQFTGASARTSSDRVGPVSSDAWITTKVVLRTDFRSFIAYGTASNSTPSAVDSSGTGFDVSYSRSSTAPRPPVRSQNRRASRARSEVQPGGLRSPSSG